MSITIPSPVWFDDLLELSSGKLSDGAATDLFNHRGIITKKTKSEINAETGTEKMKFGIPTCVNIWLEFSLWFFTFHFRLC
jgi:hypothetical protein